MKSASPENKMSLSLGLYALLSLVAFFPCLFLGRAYFDNDLLAQFGPWRAFLKNQLAQGHFPLWNPYNLGGMPFFADLQNMMLYPFNWLTLPFSVPYGLSVFFFLHMFWAAAGMHLWLRSLGLSRAACRVGALQFAASGFFWLEIIHPPILAAFAWTPWLFYFLEDWTQNPGRKAAFASGLSFAMLFLCGSFQMTVGALYGGAAYFLFRCWTSGKKLRTLGPALFFLWGSLPLLVQFIPTLELAGLSYRGTSKVSYDTFNAQLALEPLSVHQFFFPRLLLPRGISLDHAVQNPLENQKISWAGNWGYLGVWAPLLFMAAFPRKGRSLSLFLAAFLLVWLGVSLGPATPLHRIFCGLLPGFSLLQAPFRFLFLYALGASALAAKGFERLSSSGNNNPPALLIILGSLLLIPSLAGGIQTWRETSALLLGVGALGLSSFRPAWRKTALLFFQAALIFPLFLNGWGCFQTGPSTNFDFTKNSRSIQAIGNKIAPNRLLFNRLIYDSPFLKYPVEVGGKKFVVNYPQNAACALGVKNFGGYNPLTLRTKIELGFLPLKPLVQAGAIQGILVQENSGEIPGFKLESYPPYYFYGFPEPMPYAYAPKVSIVADGNRTPLALMQVPGFDLSQQIVFSTEPPFPRRPTAAKLQCFLEKDGVDDQIFKVDLSADNWVVFAEMMYPGWKAEVDGEPSPLVAADISLRSLYLKTGRHRVEFRFKPDWVRPLQIGLILWILATLGFWIGSRGPSRKPKNA